MARFPAFSHYALNAAIFMVVRQALIKYFYINPVGLWELKSLLVFSPPLQAAERERQEAIHRGGGEAEETAQEGLPRVQVPAPETQKRQTGACKWVR